MCHKRERRRPKCIRAGRGGGISRLGVARAGYLKIWTWEASLYSARKGPKQHLISSVGEIEPRVASNSESRQVHWRGLEVGGWGQEANT